MTEAIRATIRERYDRFALRVLNGEGAFESTSRARAYFRSRKLNVALALGALSPGSRVLEIGCSVGQFTFPLAERGYRMVGLDLSPGSIELAKREAAQSGQPSVEFLVGDAENLSAFSDGAFDGVMSFSTLRYVPNFLNALGEIHRVLRPGGMAVLDFPNRWCPWFYLKSWLGSERHPYDHWFSTESLARLFARAGFVNVRQRHLLFTPTVAPDRLLPFFQGADWVGERLPVVRRLAGIIMVAAEKG